MSRACSFSLGLAALMASLAAVRGEEPKTPRTDLYGDPLPPGAVARLGTIRLRHADADVVFSKDGKNLISCGCDGEVRVWDAATGELRRRKQLAWKPVPLRQVSLASDGATVAVWDHRMLTLFDTTTGNERERLSTRPNSPYPLLRISPDGKRVVVEDFDYPKARTEFRLWDIERREIRHLPLDAARRGLWELTFSPDGKRLAGIGRDHGLCLWDAITGEEIRKPKAVQGRLAIFSPDDKTLAVTALYDGSVRLLDAANGKEKAKLKAPASVKVESIRELAFSPDGQCLAGVYGDPIMDSPAEQGVLLWDLTGTKKTRRLPQRSDCRTLFAPDGKTLACWNRGAIHLWDVASGRQRCPRSGHDWKVEALAVSPDGQTIASSADYWRLLLWDAATGKLRHELETTGFITQSPLFSSDGKRILTVSDSPREGSVLRMYDIGSGKERRRFTFPQQPLRVSAVGIAADGKRLSATAEVSVDDEEQKRIGSEFAMRLYVWDTDTGKLLTQRSYRTEVRTYENRDGGGMVVGVSKKYRDHTVLAPGSNIMSVWQGIEDVATGRLLTSLPKRLDRPMLFSADGRFLAAAIVEPNELASDGDERKGLSVVETASGDELFHWDIEAIDYLAFTPDGRGLIAAEKEKLSVWDTATGTRLYQRAWPERIRDAGGKTKICSLAALPGGRVATGMAEGDILVWDLAASTWPVRKPAANLGRKELDALWTDLAGNARKAQRAIPALVAAPAQVVPFLRESLQPAAEVDTKRIDKWLVDLDCETFPVREAAGRELAGLCDRIEPRLQRALRERPSLEKRRRLHNILAEPRRPSAARLRTLRALAVLERIGTPEARDILEKLAGGAAARETREAQASLQRLNRR